MKADALLAALSIAKPSLGGTDSVIPILAHFCLDKETLYAYNDVSAILVEESTGLECALHGETLLGVLAACGSDEIKAKRDADGTVQLKTPSGWLKIPSLPLKESGFALPKGEPVAMRALDDDFFYGLALCSTSVGTDSIKPEFAGVTVCLEKSGFHLFATDNKTASRFTTGATAPSKKAVSAVIPAQSCAQIIKLGGTLKPEGGAGLALFEDGLVCDFGEVSFYSKILEAKPEAFTKVFAQHEGEGSTAPFLVPEGLAKEIAKATAVLCRETVKECTLAFEKGKLTISVKGTLGVMESTIDAACKKSAEVTVDPTLVARMLGYAEKLSVNDGRTLILHSGGGGLTHMIAARPKRAE